MDFAILPKPITKPMLTWCQSDRTEKILQRNLNQHAIILPQASVLANVVCKTSAHYSDVIMIAMASQIISLTIVNSTVYSGADQREHQSSASLAFVGQLRGKCFHLMTSSGIWFNSQTDNWLIYKQCAGIIADFVSIRYNLLQSIYKQGPLLRGSI